MLIRLRGLIFWIAFFVGLAVHGLAHLPFALISPRGAQAAGRNFFRYVMACLRLICGVRTELRGEMPTGAVVVAAKHQSMLDVFMLYANLPNARFVMKKELLSAPIFGWFAHRAGAAPVERGGGQAAMRAMVAELTDGLVRDPQYCIYPQGTRVAPGAETSYKSGVHALYAATGLACVPAATNSGVFVGKGLVIPSGLAVVEFLPPIPPGLDRDAFMTRLAREVEAASDRLVAEARGA